MIDQSTIQQARQTNLAAYLLAIGEPLTKSGTRYKHKTHDSLVFTKNAYFWNSKGESGNAVDYLTRHLGLDFEAAVSALVGFTPKKIAGQEKKEVASLGTADNFKRVFAYLHKSRGIDYKLIQQLVTDGLLEQEAETNNAVFHIRDENGEVVGAELEGTLSERRFKGVRAGSKYGYGFNLRMFEDSKTVDYIMFFESAVDLLSFADLKTNHHGKDLNGCLLVSMVGLKPNIVKHMTSTFGGQPILCPDNDPAADEFLATTTWTYLPSGKYIKIRHLRPDPQHKDWNEQLKATKEMGGTGKKDF